jgi:hypothetical protein
VPNVTLRLSMAKPVIETECARCGKSLDKFLPEELFLSEEGTICVYCHSLKEKEETKVKEKRSEENKEWRYKFAGLAMQGLLPDDTATVLEIVELSVQIADALISELEK